MARSRSERGQALILFVGIFSVILVMAAIVVDFGLWFAERRSAQRGADLAAAAGAQDLPLSPELAFTSACDWALANGYPNADVDVEVFERGGSGSEENCGVLPDDPPTPACGSQCDTVRVTVGGVAPRLFTGALGIGNFEIGAVAAAGLTSSVTGDIGGVAADQTVLLIDTDARLDDICGNLGCAFDLALEGAGNAVDALAGVAGAQVGFAPFTYCYVPYLGILGRHNCVFDELVVPPTSDVSLLRSKIAATDSVTGGTANICLALRKARAMLSSSTGVGKQSIILLSDGDNRYDHTGYLDQLPYPPTSLLGSCRPALSFELGIEYPCWNARADSEARSEERDEDRQTRDMANALKASGVEIYVIGIWRQVPFQSIPRDPCGIDDGLTQDDAGYCAGIGNADPDTTSDQRLLKCIASTPDHYRSVSVDDLPDAFEQIAAEIVSRSLLQ